MCGCEEGDLYCVSEVKGGFVRRRKKEGDLKS